MKFKCNNVVCGDDIKIICAITECYHIFCRPCTNKIIKTNICVLCGKILEKNIRFRDVSMCPDLRGFSSNVIMAEAIKGIDFLVNQMELYNAVITKSCLHHINTLNKLDIKFSHLEKSSKVKIERLELTIKKLVEQISKNRDREYTNNINVQEINLKDDIDYVTSDIIYEDIADYITNNKKEEDE